MASLGGDSDSRTLFFFKLTNSIEVDTLQTLTGAFGAVERCHVVLDEITQLPTGSALVTYVQQQDALTAKSYLHGKWFCGEYLRVAFPGEQPAPVSAQPSAAAAAAAQAHAKRPRLDDAPPPPSALPPAMPSAMPASAMMVPVAIDSMGGQQFAAADPYGLAPQLAPPFDAGMGYGFMPPQHQQPTRPYTGGKKVEDYDERQNRPPHRALFIFYVTQEVTEQMLLEAFAPFGEVLEATIPKKNDGSGEHRGFAYVTYRTVESAIEAKNHLNGVKLGSKGIRITFQKQNFGSNKNA